MHSSTTVPPTGRQYQISAGSYRATVTELGAGLPSCGAASGR
jgi:hypothetical protein